MEIVSYNSYAGFTKRFFAFIIDHICLGMVLFVPFIPFGSPIGDIDDWHFDSIWGLHTLIKVAIAMAYYVLCETSSWQGTLGKHLLGMKVVNERYQKLSMQEAVLRYLSKYLSDLFLCLGYIWIIFDTKKQGWHDKIAGTYVINV